MEVTITRCSDNEYWVSRDDISDPYKIHREDMAEWLDDAFFASNDDEVLATLKSIDEYIRDLPKAICECFGAVKPIEPPTPS